MVVTFVLTVGVVVSRETVLDSAAAMHQLFDKASFDARFDAHKQLLLSVAKAKGWNEQDIKSGHRHHPHITNLEQTHKPDPRVSSQPETPSIICSEESSIRLVRSQTKQFCLNLQWSGKSTVKRELICLNALQDRTNSTNLQFCLYCNLERNENL